MVFPSAACVALHAVRQHRHLVGRQADGLGMLQAGWWGSCSSVGSVDVSPRASEAV